MCGKLNDLFELKLPEKLCTFAKSYNMCLIICRIRVVVNTLERLIARKEIVLTMPRRISVRYVF